jgi:hypothetical protein
MDQAAQPPAEEAIDVKIKSVKLDGKPEGGDAAAAGGRCPC